MCKAPKPPPAPEVRPPQFLRNTALDSPEGSAVGQLRIGRSQLRTDLTINRQTAAPAPSIASTRERLDRQDRTSRLQEVTQQIFDSRAALSIGRF